MELIFGVVGDLKGTFSMPFTPFDRSIFLWMVCGSIDCVYSQYLTELRKKIGIECVPCPGRSQFQVGRYSAKSICGKNNLQQLSPQYFSVEWPQTSTRNDGHKVASICDDC